MKGRVTSERELALSPSFHTYLDTTNEDNNEAMILPRQNDVFFEGDGTRRVVVCDKASYS